MGTISLTTIGPDGATNASGPVQSNFQTIANLVNGNLDNANVAAAAGIVLSKLGQSGATTGQFPVWSGSAWVPGFKLYDTTLGAPAASFDTGAGGFSTSYQHLLVIAYLKKSSTAVEGARIALNGDTTAGNYDSLLVNFASPAGMALGEFVAARSNLSGAEVNTSTLADTYSPQITFFPNYSNAADHKTWIGLGGRKTANTGGANNLQVGLGIAWWRSTAAINRIQLDLGSGENYATGSRFTVYAL